MAESSALADRLERAELCFNKGGAISSDDQYSLAIHYYAKGANLSYGVGGHHPPTLSLGLCGVALIVSVKNKTKALKLLDQAKYAYPLSSRHLAFRSVTLSDLSRFSEALETVDQALQADPSNVDAHVVKGGILSQMGQYKAARDSFQAGLIIDPNFPGLKFSVATLDAILCSGQLS